MNQTQMSPLQTEEDTTEHIMVCQEGNNTYNLYNGGKWKRLQKMVAIYKNNKENRGKNRAKKKYKRKRYTIKGTENTRRRSD